MKKLLVILFVLFSTVCYSQVNQKETIDRKVDLKLDKLYSKSYSQVSIGVATTVVGFAVMMANFDITDKHKPTYIAGCAITSPLRLKNKEKI